ncbi:MAG: twin-arginine translocation signal domain-containing protein [Pseudomonadota bacterium]
MTEKTTDESRRGFLKLAATGAATQAGADEAPKSGLADTEHTRAFYASARF